MREKVKQLWKLCFNESEEFLELYFNLRYNNEVNVAMEDDTGLIASLQMLPYPMTFLGKKLPTAYVSGACTHPDHRNRGAMRELLSQAFGRMYHDHTAFTTLIPAEPWLFGYYARVGYATAFRYGTRTFQLPDEAKDSPAPDTPAPTSGNFHAYTEYDEEVYRYLNRKMQERPCCLQHTRTDFNVILADLRLGNGRIFTLSDEEGIIALAVAYPRQGTPGAQIHELMAETPEAEQRLLACICHRMQTNSLHIICPPAEGEPASDLGMIRIIQAREVLQLYAAAHPEVEADIELTDRELPVNNGYYRLSQGSCTYSPRPLSTAYRSLTIARLTQEVFASERPYMSLMLN